MIKSVTSTRTVRGVIIAWVAKCWHQNEKFEQCPFNKMYRVDYFGFDDAHASAVKAATEHIHSG